MGSRMEELIDTSTADPGCVAIEVLQSMKISSQASPISFACMMQISKWRLFVSVLRSVFGKLKSKQHRNGNLAFPVMHFMPVFTSKLNVGELRIVANCATPRARFRCCRSRYFCIDLLQIPCGGVHLMCRHEKDGFLVEKGHDLCSLWMTRGS